MRTTPLYRVAVMGIASLAVAGLVGGCATKKTKSANAGSASTSSSAAATSAATSAAATAAATTSAAGPSLVKATGGGKFCQQVASTVNNEALKAATTGTGADSIKTSIQAFHNLEGPVLKSAPGEIKPDLVTLFGALDKFYAAFAAANYDFTKVDPSIVAPLETPAVKAAEQRVDAYMKNTCGIDVGGGAAAAASS